MITNDILIRIFVFQFVIFYLWNVVWLVPDILKEPYFNWKSKVLWIIVICIPGGFISYPFHKQFKFYDLITKVLSSFRDEIVMLPIFIILLVLLKIQRYKILGIYLAFVLYIIGVLIFAPAILKEKEFGPKDKIFWIINVVGGGLLGAWLYYYFFRKWGLLEEVIR